MRNYLLIKTAAGRFVLDNDVDDLGNAKVVSSLADKAGIREHNPVALRRIDKDGIAGSYSPLFNRIEFTKDDFLGDTKENKRIINPLVLLHEYGHVIDNEEGIKGWRGFFEKYVPNSYLFFHPEFEQVADNNAQRLIDQIENPEDRAELKRIYSRVSAGNLYYSKVAKPREVGSAIGGIVGGATLGAGGGYLGYKAGDKLFDYMTSRMPKNQRWNKPEAMRNFLRFSGAAVGGMGGYVLGDTLGGKAGYAIGDMLIDPNKKQQFNRIYDKLESRYGEKLNKDALDIFNKLKQPV